MKRNILTIVIVVLVSIWAIVAARGAKNEPAAGPQQVQQQVVSKAFPTQTDSRGEVEIEVTPKVLEIGKEASFQVTFNTHSVELDKDLTKVSKLIDDQGNQYEAVSWSGGTGGHHLSGDLIFPKISDQAKSAELLISGIGGVDRKFKWEL